MEGGRTHVQLALELPPEPLVVLRVGPERADLLLRELVCPARVSRQSSVLSITTKTRVEW